MKKILVMVALFTTVYATNANAQQQGGADSATRVARMKEMIKPQLIEKLKLTDAQADKVIEINIASRQQMRGMRDLSEADRTKKIEEIQAANSLKYKQIPLTDDQVKAVNDFYAEMRKNMQRGGGMNGGNRNNNSQNNQQQ